MGRLDGLSDQEKFACGIVERSINAVAHAWDVGGRQGAVDAKLNLEDGRLAAFEVTSLSSEGAIHTDRLLDRARNVWPLPGQWWWTISVESPRDIPRLKLCYRNIILICEASGVAHPEHLGWDSSADPDLKWLVQESSSSMVGHPAVPAPSAPGDGAMVVPETRGGAVDRELEGLGAALETEFAQNHMPRHIEKLLRADADESHLFICLHVSALPFSVTYALMSGESLPPEPPPLPDGIACLWLAPDFARRVLQWHHRSGWTNHHPFDN